MNVMGWLRKVRAYRALKRIEEEESRETLADSAILRSIAEALAKGPYSVIRVYIGPAIYHRFQEVHAGKLQGRLPSGSKKYGWTITYDPTRKCYLQRTAETTISYTFSPVYGDYEYHIDNKKPATCPYTGRTN